VLVIGQIGQERTGIGAGEGELDRTAAALRLPHVEVGVEEDPRVTHDDDRIARPGVDFPSLHGPVGLAVAEVPGVETEAAHGELPGRDGCHQERQRQDGRPPPGQARHRAREALVLRIESR
jgi:hypothetical protein